MTTNRNHNAPLTHVTTGATDPLASPRTHDALTRQAEGGYALVALLAVMTIMALAFTAAAPSIRQQRQRELEKEAIARGEEVAEAIRLYVRARGVLPTSLNQLREGIPVGIKKVQIVRASALIDPLSSSGEWRLIRPNDAKLLEFQRDIALYTGGFTPPTREPALQQFVAQMTALINTRTKDSKETAPGGEDSSPNNTGAFIGVASRSRRNSVLTYYGIDSHDRWIFTPLFR